MGSVPNCRKEIPARHAIRWFKCKLKPPKKLSIVVRNVEQEIRREDSVKVPAIDLLMRIQSALDENSLFLENSSVNILDIINTIPDKGMTAWKEKLSGCHEVSSEDAKALMNSMKKKNDSGTRM